MFKLITISLFLILSPFVFSKNIESIDAHFNIPKSFLFRDKTPEKVLISYLSYATPGSRVYMTFYQLGSKDVFNAIKGAAKRKVNFNIIMDDSSYRDAYKEITNKLKSLLKPNQITVCSKPSCRNNYGNNHNKFFLFEHVTMPSGKEVEYVSIQTSHNFKFSQEFNYNDMLVFKNNTQVYNAFLSYWEDLKSEEPIADYMSTKRGSVITSDKFTTSLYFSPSLDKDPFLDALRDFDCGPTGKVLIAQSFFKGLRGQKTMEHLKEIRNRSPQCKIELILRNNKHHNPFKKRLIKANFKVFVVNRLLRLGVGVHAKILLLENSLGEKLIFTGSMNLKDDSLSENEEVLLSVKSDELFAKYLVFWEAMKPNSLRFEKPEL